MKKQNAGLIALSIVFILMGGFSTIYNLSKYVSNRVFMSSAEKTTGYVKWIDHELKTWGHNKKASNKAETYYITVAFDVGGKEYTREIFTGTYYVSQNEKVNVYYNTDKNGEPDKVVTDIDNGKRPYLTWPIKLLLGIVLLVINKKNIISVGRKR